MAARGWGEVARGVRRHGCEEMGDWCVEVHELTASFCAQVDRFQRTLDLNEKGMIKVKGIFD